MLFLFEERGKRSQKVRKSESLYSPALGLNQLTSDAATFGLSDFPVFRTKKSKTLFLFCL